MKKAVVIFKLDEADGSYRAKVNKDDGFRGIDLHSAIGGLYADVSMEIGEPIACLSGMVKYISDKTGKEWHEILDEIEEILEEGANNTEEG